MVLRSLFKSLFPARASQSRNTPQSASREPLHLGGSNWLVHGRHGLFLASDNDLYIGRALIHYGEYGELEWRLLARYARSGGVFVEVGANIGTLTVPLARAAGASGRVIAIEPQPVIFQRLCANVALNALLNVDTVSCGCGAAPATMAVPLMDYESEGNFGGIALEASGTDVPSRPVRIERLDDLLRDSVGVDLLKVDVEGMELDVLAGAGETIARNRPVIYIENDRMDRSQRLIETLWSHGYDLWWHSPLLFNRDNYFALDRDMYPRVASSNMLCVHRESNAPWPDDLKAVTDATQHPFR